MKIISSLEQLHRYESKQGCVIALGTFDGLHRGHQQVLEEAAALSKSLHAALGVLTFSNHPMALINPAKTPPALLTIEDRHVLFESMGVELLLELPFDRALADITPQEFVEQLLNIGCRGIAVGANFTYGKYGAGNVQTLTAAAEQQGFKLRICPLLELENNVLSSTLIRALVKQGQVEKACRLLGRPYSLQGIVAHGNERGRLLGFSTANLELSQLEEQLVIPAEGAYAVRAVLEDGSVHKAMANIGKNPTYGDVEQLRLEVHLLDYSGNLYDKKIKVQFVKRLRDQVKFFGLEQLQSQLEQDKARCREIL